MTPSMKLKRPQLQQRFQPQVSSLSCERTDVCRSGDGDGSALPGSTQQQRFQPPVGGWLAVMCKRGGVPFGRGTALPGGQVHLLLSLLAAPTAAGSCCVPPALSRFSVALPPAAARKLLATLAVGCSRQASTCPLAACTHLHSSRCASPPPANWRRSMPCIATSRPHRQRVDCVGNQTAAGARAAWELLRCLSTAASRPGLVPWAGGAVCLWPPVLIFSQLLKGVCNAAGMCGQLVLQTHVSVSV